MEATATVCSLERIGDVYVLRFKGDVDEHRLSAAVCKEIMDCLAIVNSSDAKALVTTNEGKFFSNGLDRASLTGWIAWMAQDPTTSVQPQSEPFNKLLECFMRVNVPTIAAICGHAAGAGFILALAHDHRHMHLHRGFLYMSEMDARMLLPSSTVTLIRYKLQARASKEVMLRATKLTPAAAQELGVLDAAHPTAAATFAAALADATQLARRNWDKDVYLRMRLSMYPDLFVTQALSSKL